MSKTNWVELLNLTEEHMEDMQVAGFAYIRQGKYDIALSFFEALAILDPENPYHTQTLGGLYIQMEKPEKALIYLEKALKYDTDHTPTLLNLCKALFMLNKKDDALRLAKVLSRDPHAAVSNTAKALLLAFG